jgi:thiosulfate dehydrogenase [quinone] large subunit
VVRSIGADHVIGIFTGVAAFFGAFMNMNYMLAGYYGVDRWLLPGLGTPWELGTAFRKSGAQANAPGA